MDLSEKVLHYETFVNETLKRDLKKVLDERDKVYSEISEYLQLKNVIINLQENQCLQKKLKTKVDLGCNIYVQAEVPDPSRICVCVGFGFYVEFTHHEALAFIEKKVKHLTVISENLTSDAVSIKTRIKIVLEGLREIQGIDDRPPEKPRRDLFT